MWVLLQRFASWLGPVLAPIVITIFFNILVGFGFAAITFTGVTLLIEEIYTMIDTMLSGLIPLNSKKIVEAAGLFLALKIYLYALGTRLSIVLSFMVYGWSQNLLKGPIGFFK